MQQLRAFVERSVWIRVAVVGALIVVLAWTFGLTPRERLHVGLWLAYWAGYFAPALVIGGLIGFVTWNKRGWVMTTGAGVLLTVVVIFAH
jgi:hypothetical protein